MPQNVQKDAVALYFRKPDDISPNILEEIEDLIKEGGGVGSSLIKENLQNAFLVSYALDQKGAVAGTVVLKHPQEKYRRKIEKATGLNLSRYLERGYTTVKPEFREQDIPDALIKGLIERSEGKKIYVTIRMDNVAALKLTYKNNMVLAAKFIYDRTGHEIGVFVNQ